MYSCLSSSFYILSVLNKVLLKQIKDVERGHHDGEEESDHVESLLPRPSIHRPWILHLGQTLNDGVMKGIAPRGS
jgi:hypothetical protein